MEAVAVEEVVVALEPLWALAEGPTLHVCVVVLHQSVLKHDDGSLVVPSVIQPHPRCEGVLRRERETATGREDENRRFRVNPSLTSPFR